MDTLSIGSASTSSIASTSSAVVVQVGGAAARESGGGEVEESFTHSDWTHLRDKCRAIHAAQERLNECRERLEAIVDEERSARDCVGAFI